MNVAPAQDVGKSFHDSYIMLYSRIWGLGLSSTASSFYLSLIKCGKASIYQTFQCSETYNILQ